MTRLWPQGEPISVQADEQLTPQSFSWQGQHHPVQQIAKRWRVDQGWWRGRLWREYFKVATGSGLLVVLYRDFLSGEWFLQRVYD